MVGSGVEGRYGWCFFLDFSLCFSGDILIDAVGVSSAANHNIFGHLELWINLIVPPYKTDRYDSSANSFGLPMRGAKELGCEVCLSDIYKKQ